MTHHERPTRYSDAHLRAGMARQAAERRLDRLTIYLEPCSLRCCRVAYDIVSTLLGVPA